MNLDKYSYQELLRLKEKVNNKLDLNGDFWNAISNIKVLSIKKDDLDISISKIETSQVKLKSLKDLGYTIVIYDFNRIGIIDYKRNKKDGKYFGCSFTKSESHLDFSHYIKPSKEDIAKIEKIIYKKSENEKN